MFLRYNAGMEKKYTRPVCREDLESTVEFALSKSEKLWPKKRWPEGDHLRMAPMAKAIVDHLYLCNIRCFRGPPAPAHSDRHHRLDPPTN